MLAYIWMGIGVVVTGAVAFLIIKELVRATQSSSRGEKGDYDFDID